MNKIENNLSDAIIEKPIRFNVGDHHYSIHPPTLGKMQLLKELYHVIDVNSKLLAENPLAETLRIAKENPDIVSQIISYSTFKAKNGLLDSARVMQRARLFADNMSAEELATILSLILSADHTEEFIMYFGLDKERLKRQEISRLKGDGNSITFGGRSIYGLLIDFACQRYGWTLDYVLWEISLVNLNMLMADAITTVYLSDEERKQLGRGVGEVINADDPRNRELIREMIRE